MKGKPMKAWILGGSSGLGAELVKEADRRGIDSLILGRSSDLRVDLADQESVQALCKKISELPDEEIRLISFFVWNAGELECAPVEAMKNTNRLFAVNAESPTAILQALVARKKVLASPLHIIAVSSVASWKARADMAVYAGTKAYQAQYLRCLGIELGRDLPGSKVTIALPAGMKTELFPADVDTSQFMEPSAVAQIIWNEARGQKVVCDWFNILRVGNAPVVSRARFEPELACGILLRHNRPSS